MNAEFCPRDCEHLSITEAEQNKSSNHHKPHVCLKYNATLYLIAVAPPRTDINTTPTTTITKPPLIMADTIFTQAITPLL